MLKNKKINKTVLNPLKRIKFKNIDLFINDEFKNMLNSLVKYSINNYTNFL